jgi:hypothetical protein
VTDGRFLPTKTPDGKEVPDPRNRPGKIHCLVCENGLAPVLAIFVRSDPKELSPDKGLGELLFQVNKMISIPKYRANKLASFVMFLRLEGGIKPVTVKTTKDGTEVEEKKDQDFEYPDDENRKVNVDAVKAFASAMNVPNIPFGLAAVRSSALKAWGVGEDNKAEKKDDVPLDDVTVILYYRMRFAHEPWRFKKASEISTDKVNEITKAIETLLTDK